jgi:hypothetical protein
MPCAIGTSLETLTALSDFTVFIPEPTAHYSQFSDSEDTGDGGRVGLGSPVLIWRFELLEFTEQRDQLYAFCNNGASDDVVIQSPIKLGGEDHYFDCKMVWPVPEPENNNGLGISLDIEFRRLAEIVEGS